MELEKIKFLKEEDDSQAREEEQKMSKSIQDYKDTMTLIKVKMTKADVLIRQYNDKMKECDILNQELNSVRNEKQDIINKHNLTMEKLTRLELSNINYEQSTIKYKNMSDKQKLKLDENEQHINQLRFKIKDLESKNLVLEDSIKNLQQNIKSAKLTVKTVEKRNSVQLKHESSQTISSAKQNSSVNTEKLVMIDKNTVTDECISIKTEPFPIFCTKCNVHVSPAPVEQILKIMSSEPPLLSEYFSPPNSPKLNKSLEDYQPIETNIVVSEQGIDKELSNEKCQNSIEELEKSNYSSFMEIDKLTRKINKLEDLIKKSNKVKKERNKCCQQNCCSSKNIKFVVQLPDEKKFYEYRKREKRKMKLIKRLNNIKIHKERRKNLFENKWHIESCEEPKIKKIINKLSKKDSSKSKKLASQEKLIDLFECPNIGISKERYNDNSISSCVSEENLVPSFSNMFSKTSPEKFRETNLNINENSTIIDINLDKFEMEHQNLSCDLITSQASECKNIYGNVATEIKDIHLIENEIAKNNTTNHSNNLHETIFSTSEAEQIVSISDNSIDKNKISVQAFHDHFDVNETVFMQHNEIQKDQHYNEINNRLSIQELDESRYFSEIVDVRVNGNDSQDIEKENKENEKKQNNDSEAHNFERRKIFLSNDDSFQNDITNNLYQETNNQYITKECLLIKDMKVLNKQIEDIHKNSNSLDEKCIENILQEKNKNINFKSDKNDEKIENTQLFSIKPEIHEKNIAMVDTNVYSNVENILPLEILKDTIHLEENITDNQQTNNIKCNIISSDDSSESRFFSSSGIKRLKANTSNNIILSDESSEDRSTETSTTIKRKKLNGNEKNHQKANVNRKKLLSKIKNIKKTSKKPIISNKWEYSKSLIKERSLDSLIPLNSSMDIQFSSSSRSSSISINELSPNSNVKIDDNESTEDIPLKKQRIAHIPKNTYNSKNIKPTTPISKTIRKISSSLEKQMEESCDKVSSIIEEFNRNCKERQKVSELAEGIKPLLPSDTCVQNIDKTKIYEDLDVRENKNSMNAKTAIQMENITENTKSSVNNVLQETDFLQTKENEDISPMVDSCDDNNINLANENKCSTINRKKITRRKKIISNAQDKSPVRKLRSRQVVISYSSKGKRLKTKNQNILHKIDNRNSCLHESTIVSCLNDYISDPENSIKRQRHQIDLVTLRRSETIIEEQIKLLLKNEWTTEVTSEVTKNLADLSNLKILAYAIIEYIGNNILNDEDFDKSHTPPAPMMTRSEQKLVTLILNIGKINPEFYDLIQEGIQYKLFRLGNPQDVQIVERLFRILVVLNKIRKDREKVRMFCCDALYCLNLRAINIIYVALTCWPEIFPMHDSNNDIIVKTIVHIIMTLNVNTPYPKLNSLRKLLSTYYGYPNCGHITKVFKDDLLKMLQENVPGINTAVLLLCKKLGPAWSSENIIVGLKQIIVTKAHPSLYNVLTLLGNILRPFQTLDQNVVCQIINQLCDVLASNEASDDVQEGTVSCLLSISKFSYIQVACSVMKWQFHKDIRPTTKDKLISFFKHYDPKWWLKFIQTNFPLPQ